MSSSDDSSTDASQEPAGVVNGPDDEKTEVDIISKKDDILTKIESGFSGITKKFMKHSGKEFADGTLKGLLECAICKEIMIGTVSRKCAHNFCHHCLTNWSKRSANCPICRHEGCLIVKNPLIDQFIDLFVDLTFTEEEKTERSNLVQQRSLPSSDSTEENATLLHFLLMLSN